MDYARRLLKGRRYSQDDLIHFLILVIHTFGGSAKKNQVDDKMFEILHSEFSKDIYQETVANNVERWKHDIAWAKERAKQHHGFIKSAVDAGWGIWELTKIGREQAAILIKQFENADKVKIRKKKT